MKKLSLIIFLALAIAGCSDGPSESEIEKAATDVHNFGLKFLGVDGPKVDSIDWYECKELTNELAWACHYTVVFEDGETLNSDGKFVKTSDGWIRKSGL